MTSPATGTELVIREHVHRLELNAALDVLLADAVPRLGEWCFIDAIDEAHYTRRIAVAHPAGADPALVRALEAYPGRFDPAASSDELDAAPVLLTCPLEVWCGSGGAQGEHDQPYCIALRTLAPRSAIIAGVCDRGRVLGRVTLLHARSDRAHHEQDVEDAAALARDLVVTLVLEGREHILRSVSGSCGDTCPNLSSLIGHTHAELAPELHRELGPMLDEVYTSGRPRVILDLEVRDRVNETRHSRISLIPLPGDRGHARGVVLMSLDVTESVRVEKDRAELLAREREARERAEHADRMKDEFLARVSHELATPLAAMRMWIHLLRKRSHDEHGHELDSIERCADAQSRLVTDLLDVSRAIRGKLSLDLKTFDLAQVMTPVIDGLRGDADSKQVSLAARLDPECIVRGDVKRLGQVATNLITNALKFTREGGKVTVTVAHRGAGVMLTVDDDGVGIEPRQLAKIFEPFWQADGSATRSQGGLGLGLAIVRQIVELHGGSVRALSEGRDRGARLEVSLPAAEASGEDEERGAHASSLDGTDILLVEDDAETRASVTMVLKSFGANVRVASSAELGARELAEKVPDVLLCDVAMPGEDGYSLMRRVRKADGPEAQVLAIAFTAHARDEDRARAREAGFNDHLAKPIAPLELASALAKITQQKRVSD